MSATTPTPTRRPTDKMVSGQVQAWPPPQGQWTYDDYKRLPDDGWKYEVIEGELHMVPAPRPKHQKSVVNLITALSEFARDHQAGEVYVSPIDVILPGLASPVQPDVLFISRQRLDIVKDDFIEGPPDLIVEILSPSNWLDDRRVKFRVYEQAGVREYWIVDPDASTVEVFVLQNERYAQAGRYGQAEVVRSETLAGFEIAVGAICVTV